MKKISLLLSTLILVGCGTQNLYPQQFNNIQVRFTKQASSFTAKTGYPIALKEVKQLLHAPQLFEIDVWKENDSDAIHYGFMQQRDNGSYQFIRVMIDRQSGEVTHESISKGGKIPTPVNMDHWKIDHQQILLTAQQNGLRDQTFLATLWEDTWHISGLKQHLYFQINSQNGQINMRCTGPYLDHCTDADLNPITPKLSLRFQEKR